MSMAERRIRIRLCSWCRSYLYDFPTDAEGCGWAVGVLNSSPDLGDGKTLVGRQNRRSSARVSAGVDDDDDDDGPSDSSLGPLSDLIVMGAHHASSLYEPCCRTAARSSASGGTQMKSGAAKTPLTLTTLVPVFRLPQRVTIDARPWRRDGQHPSSWHGFFSLRLTVSTNRTESRRARLSDREDVRCLSSVSSGNTPCPHRRNKKTSQPATVAL